MGEHLRAGSRVPDLRQGFQRFSQPRRRSPQIPATSFADGRSRLVIGMDVGGGYDAYSRLVGRYLSKYDSRQSDRNTAEHDRRRQPPCGELALQCGGNDGSVIGALTEGTPLDQARQQLSIQFDATRIQWIGNPIVDNQITLAYADSGLATLEDVKAKGGLICGGTGASTPPIVFPRIINRLLGTDIRIIPGYPGAGPMVLAMQRGEINCLGSHAWSSTKATAPNSHGRP